MVISTRYNAIYEAIRFDILCGKYANNEHLPSIQALCMQYDVSRNTIRHALQLLEDHCFITCCKGNYASILNDEVYSTHASSYQKTLVAKKDAILEVYKTLGLFMPIVARTALAKCTPIQRATLEKQISSLMNEHVNSNELMKQLKIIYSTGLSLLHNEILSHLVESMMNFAFCYTDDITMQQNDTKKQLQIIRGVFLKQLIHAIISNPRIVEKTLPLFCSMVASQTKAYVENQCYGIQVKTTIHYEWVNAYYQNILYIKVCANILKQIEAGRYPQGSTLPSIQELMEQYHVSKNTIRKANDVLQKAGIILVKNGLGSVVVVQQGYDFKKLIYQSAVQDYVNVFHESFEIFIWIFQSFTKGQLLSIPQEEYQAMIKTYKDECLVLAIFQTICKIYGQTLFTICKQLYQGFTWFYLLQGTMNMHPNYVTIMDNFGKFKEALSNYEVMKAKRYLITLLEMVNKQLYEIRGMQVE